MKASMTVEAALIMSILFLMLGWVIGQAVEMYQQVQQTAAETRLDELEPAAHFRRIQLLGELTGQGEE